MQRDAVEATYKSREIEGFLDLHFYRKVGFQLARFFAWVGFTPNGVTVIGTLIGIAAGHLYFYRDLATNLVGMCLHVLANAMDNADGQLARMTNRYSPSGRVLDGIGDNLIYVSIYLHLCLRYLAEGGSHGVWVVALLAGLSHRLQSETAEFCRDAYLRFAVGKLGSLELSSDLRPPYEAVTWRTHFWKKLLLKIHLGYVAEQERLCPGLARLEETARRTFAGGVPQAFRDRYRQMNRTMISFFFLLRTNTRMLLLFLLLFLAQPVWYFAIELTALNFLLVFLAFRQNAICRRLEPLVTEHAY
ncbi:MAG: CDP-alcohol phosphatidyltransferase family protein [Verrucomicrobiota bacterium]|nr:CDP-alcohol phosphatidyltransferase family protein [Verrucomicrobiota bacterium]